MCPMKVVHKTGTKKRKKNKAALSDSSLDDNIDENKIYAHDSDGYHGFKNYEQNNTKYKW
jgi:hypothetical protein